MTRAGEFYEPNLEHQRQYDELFTQVYKKLYKGLKPLYERIRKITGYPE
jgi:sugar (pentulose or hexulose) kinase